MTHDEFEKKLISNDFNASEIKKWFEQEFVPWVVSS